MGRIEQNLARAHQLLLRARNELDNNWPSARVYHHAADTLREAHQVMGQLRTLIRHNPPRGAVAFFRRLERAERRMTQETSGPILRRFDAQERYQSTVRNLTAFAALYNRAGGHMPEGTENQIANVLRLARPLLRGDLITRDQRQALNFLRADLGAARYHFHLRNAERLLRAVAVQGPNAILLVRAMSEYQQARGLHLRLVRLQRSADFEAALPPSSQVGSRVSSLLSVERALRTAVQGLPEDSLEALISLRRSLPTAPSSRS